MRHEAPFLNAAILVLASVAALVVFHARGELVMNAAILVLASVAAATAQSAAIKQLRLGAQQGDAAAQSNLGGMYRRGEGVPQDNQEAAKWYRLAADQGYATAQYFLGGMYAKGKGVSQDNQEAAKWYRLAADQGDAGGSTHPWGDV